MAENNLKQVKRTKMGATNPRYAKVAKREAGKIPVYDGTVTQFSELVAVTEALDYAEASFYSNNRKSESNRSFKGCTLTYDNKGLPQAVVADIYGAEFNDEDELEYGSADAAPRIGFTFFRELEDEGTRYYEGVFYPDCKASIGNATDNTRGENITYNGETTTLDAYALDDLKGRWKIEKIFATAAEADAWCVAKLTPAGT